MPAKDFMEVAKKVYANNYMHFLAKTIGLTVWGAPLGLGANLRMAGGRNYMYVKSSVIQTWCKTHLKAKVDAGGYISYG